MAPNFTPEQRQALRLAKEKRAILEQLQQQMDVVQAQIQSASREQIRLGPLLRRAQVEADQARQAFLDLVDEAEPTLP